MLRVLDYAAAAGWPLETRFAALCHDLGKGGTPTADWPRPSGYEANGVALVEALCLRVRATNECRDLAVLVCREHAVIHRALSLRATVVADLLTRCDALRKPERFDRLLDACMADARGRAEAGYPQAQLLRQCRDAARAVDAGAVAMAVADKSKIAEAVRQARIDAVRPLLREMTGETE
jgi:tRNA nucleotidyltransferase (CCA-adding enzyme)